MTNYQRITGKVFGSAATATGDDPEIGQFGSALAGTYNGTTDVATIQSLPAWQNGFISAVTPTEQFPPLPEMTGFGKVLSYQICYLLQKGVPAWDSGTTYYTNDWCSYNGSLYISKADENLNNLPTDTTKWTKFTGASSRQLGEYVTSSLPLTDTTLHLADGSLLNSSDYPELVSYISSIYSSIPSEYEFSQAQVVSNLGNNNWQGFAYGSGKFVAIGEDGYISTSTDGESWTLATQNVTLGANYWSCIAYGNSKFVACNRGGQTSISTDGINWSQPETIYISGMSPDFVKILFDGTRFVAFPQTVNGEYYTSVDGENWSKGTYTAGMWGTETIRGVTYGNGKYVILVNYDDDGYQSAGIMYSTDLTNWTSLLAYDGKYTIQSISRRWRGIGYNGEYFVATNGAGDEILSQDLTNWTKYDINNVGDVVTIYYDNNGYGTILGSTGTIATSLSTPANPFVSEAEWQTINTTYGECGKYVYNAGAGTVRIPSVNSFFKNTISTSDLGDLTPASIPNVKGTFSGVGQAFHSPSWPATLTGDFYRVNTTNNPIDGAPIQTGGSVQNDDVFGLDASRGSSVYSDSATTINPQSIKQLVYIVVAK